MRSFKFTYNFMLRNDSISLIGLNNSLKSYKHIFKCVIASDKLNRFYFIFSSLVSDYTSCSEAPVLLIFRSRLERFSIAIIDSNILSRASPSTYSLSARLSLSFFSCFVFNNSPIMVASSGVSCEFS